MINIHRPQLYVTNWCARVVISCGLKPAPRSPIVFCKIGTKNTALETPTTTKPIPAIKAHLRTRGAIHQVEISIVTDSKKITGVTIPKNLA